MSTLKDAMAASQTGFRGPKVKRKPKGAKPIDGHAVTLQNVMKAAC